VFLHARVILAARASHCIATSNEYSSLQKTPSFLITFNRRRAARTLGTFTHKQGEARRTSPRLAYRMVGEARRGEASRMWECPLTLIPMLISTKYKIDSRKFKSLVRRILKSTLHSHYIHKSYSITFVSPFCKTFLDKYGIIKFLSEKLYSKICYF